jgi:hypothetical protein
MLTLYATVPYWNAFNEKFMKECMTCLDQHLGTYIRRGGGVFGYSEFERSFGGRTNVAY